jgi:hypothetical protein
MYHEVDEVKYEVKVSCLRGDSKLYSSYYNSPVH